jgi:hypothetical protein
VQEVEASMTHEPAMCPHGRPFEDCTEPVCRIAASGDPRVSVQQELRSALARLAAMLDAAGLPRDVLHTIDACVTQVNARRSKVEAVLRRTWAAQADHSFRELTRQRDDARARADAAEAKLAALDAAGRGL